MVEHVMVDRTSFSVLPSSFLEGTLSPESSPRMQSTSSSDRHISGRRKNHSEIRQNSTHVSRPFCSLCRFRVLHNTFRRTRLQWLLLFACIKISPVWPQNSHVFWRQCCTGIFKIRNTGTDWNRFHPIVTRVRFRSWQCEFFERPKAPLGWTALILDMCEKTTIETNLRNSFNTSYGVTNSRNINKPNNN